MRGLLLAILMLLSGAARAAEIVIGLSTAPSSADPHYHALGPNNQLAHHVFGTLLTTDAGNRLIPSLATSWTLEGDRTWRLALRPGVVFHDGTPFTAADVIYSLCRVLHPSGPTASFQQASRDLEAVEADGDLGVRLRMHATNPAFLSELERVNIISAHSAGARDVRFGVDSACGDIPSPPATDFDSLRMANGTGPYRLVRYVSGDQLTLEANPAYWGPKPRWDRVVMRALPNAGARLAGLLAGELDLIENPSAQDLPVIKGHGGLAWVVVPSDRIVYLQPDVARDPSPLAARPDGHNPLRDPRVRQAISLAIDRRAIATRLMDGMGIPADRYTPAGMFGALEAAPARAYDPPRAKQLLAEAGAVGMRLTLSATRDRYLDDAAVAQAIGQYLTRVGIVATVDVMPQNVFFPRRAKRDFSLAMGSYGFSSEGASYLLRPWLADGDSRLGNGGSNYGGWHDDRFQFLLSSAMTEMDDRKRSSMLREAERIALDSNALIPLHWETSVWAFKDRYVYSGRIDQLTDADSLQLKAP